MIAVTTPKRIGILPQIETVAESLPGFSFTVWGGLFAPKATPKPIIDQLNREINLFLSNPDVKNQLEADSIAVPINPVSEFQEFVQIEANKYEKLIKQAQIKLE